MPHLYCTLRMNIFNRKPKWKNFGGNINILRDIKKSDISKIISEERIHSLQFYEFKTPNNRTWETLNEFFKKYPDIRLRILWYNQMDFSFYQLIPSLRKLSIASYLTKDFTPLLANCELTSLGIEETKSVATDLSFIRKFSKLESLYIDGMKKGLESISELSELKTLTLRGVKMKDLDIIHGLNKLRELNLLYGSYKNLDGIANLADLEVLEISRTRQIPNYNFLNSLSNLRSLCFEGMSQLERLPSLRGLKNLTKIQIDNNSRLADINSVSELQSLQEFLLFFPENFKAALRKKLRKQAFEIILASKTIKSTNLLRTADDGMKVKLKEKGIKQWGYNPIVEKIFEKE